MSEGNSYSVGDGNLVLVFSCAPKDVTYAGKKTVETFVDTLSKWEKDHKGWIQLPNALYHFKTEVAFVTSDSIVFRAPSNSQPGPADSSEVAVSRTQPV